MLINKIQLGAGTLSKGSILPAPGFQLLLQAANFDVTNVPSRPIHPYLRILAGMERAARA